MIIPAKKYSKPKRVKQLDEYIEENVEGDKDGE